MSIDRYAIKRNRLREIQGGETINQVEHIRSAGAKLMMGGVLVPGDVVQDDMSSAAVNVGAGSILRMEIASTTYVVFGTDDTAIGTVDSSSTPSLKLAAGIYLVVATDAFVKTDVNPTRVEVIQDPIN